MRVGMPGSWWLSVTEWLSKNFANGEFPYVVCEVILIYFFSYFWITVQFNPEEMAKQLRDHGSFIPGLRPGPRTAEYLETVMERITYVGAAFLAVIAVSPMVINHALNIPNNVTQFLGGTGLLIVVSVIRISWPVVHRGERTAERLTAPTPYRRAVRSLVVPAKQSKRCVISTCSKPEH